MNSVRRADGHVTIASMEPMPLACDYLCEDCQCDGNCAEQCPACASTVLTCLAGVLNRTISTKNIQNSYAFELNSNATTLAA